MPHYYDAVFAPTKRDLLTLYITKLWKILLPNRACANKGTDRTLSKLRLNRDLSHHGLSFGAPSFSLYSHNTKMACKYYFYAVDTHLYIDCKLTEHNEAIQTFKYIWEDIAKYSRCHSLNLISIKNSINVYGNTKLPQYRSIIKFSQTETTWRYNITTLLTLSQ